MSFSKLREQITTDLERIDSIQDYQRIYLSKEVLRSLEQLNKKFVEHLFEDLINEGLNINIRAFLSDNYKSNIHGARIKTWTNSALKCFDLFLIKLINDYLKEKIKKSGTKPKERDVYDHLINKGGNHYEVGIAFQTIYQQRNEFTHIQYERKEGIRSTKRWSRSKYDFARDLILKQFEKGLNALIKEIKTYGI